MDMSSMFRLFDTLLDRITMYRLLLYYLITLLLVAMIFGQVGQLHFSPLSILFSTTVLLAACWLFNKLFAWLLAAPTNYESSLITALILALIFSPPTTGFDGVGRLLMAALVAMASKYVLAINHQHIFNPAAIAAVLMALGPRQPASWWIGTAVMLPFVIVGGLLLVRKLRRFQMVLLFQAAALVATAVSAWLTHGQLSTNLKEVILDSGLFFMAYVMFTEPMTAPPTLAKQRWYAVLVGVLFPPQVHILSLYSTPELALVAGNLYSYVVSPKVKLFLKLKAKTRLTPTIMEFTFTPRQTPHFEPGQYMEWTLPHPQPDARGNRRYFTLASSPTEPDIRLGVKLYPQGSSFKRALRSMGGETTIVAGRLAGDFVLPKDKSKKLVFIAGGIGVTPFRSMVQCMLDTQEQRSVRLLYAVRTPRDIVYQEVFEAARQRLAMQTVYAVSDSSTLPQDNRYKPGYIDAAMIKVVVPDYADRIFYISGPQPMVEAVRESLATLGVPGRQIKLDFFPGYA
jgi:ferredoxin-NADP reductase/Na+-transporting NADH:ubiquinone oxidoreductase subunit NqrB